MWYVAKMNSHMSHLLTDSAVARRLVFETLTKTWQGSLKLTAKARQLASFIKFDPRYFIKEV